MLQEVVTPDNVMITAGILDTVTSKSEEGQETVRAVAVVAALGFMLYRVFLTKFTLAGIVMSGLAAGVFLWFIWNVTQVRDQVGEDLDASPAIVQQAPEYAQVT